MDMSADSHDARLGVKLHILHFSSNVCSCTIADIILDASSPAIHGRMHSRDAFIPTASTCI